MTTATLRSGTMPGWANPVGRGPAERRLQLVDVRELRVAPANVELRALRNGDLVATGYASTFEEYEVYGGPENYGWIERIDPTAFTKTMAAKPDVVYLINHDGLPLARTKSGTLKLGVDQGGLAVEALLEKTDPDVLALQPKMARGDVDEMSFAFYVKAQAWSSAPGWEDDPYSYRLITELSIHRGDVSVVTFGANPTTSASLGVVGTDSHQLGARSHIDLGAGAPTPPPAANDDQRPAQRQDEGVAQAVADRTQQVSVEQARAGQLPSEPVEQPTQVEQAGEQAETTDDQGGDEGRAEVISLADAKVRLGLSTGVASLRASAGLPETGAISLADARAAAPKAE